MSFGGIGLGAGLGLAGGAMSLYGGYKAGRSKSKAAKAQYAAMKKALEQYKAGSIDALGNKLSANDKGVWSYDLNNSGQAAKNAANNANYLLGTTANKSANEIARDNLMGNHFANTMTARANQAAAMRSGARTNSNLGKISDSFGRAGSQMLRDNYLQGVKASKNAAIQNANMRNALASSAQNANAPIQNIQNNLQNMVGNLNATQMNQGNNLAQATSNPYMHGMANADLWKGLGGFTSSLGQNYLQQQNMNNFLGALGQNQGNGNGGLDMITTLSLAKMLFGGA